MVLAVLQVAVDESPQLWWQHAGRAVLTERAQVDGQPAPAQISAGVRRDYA